MAKEAGDLYIGKFWGLGLGFMHLLAKVDSCYCQVIYLFIYFNNLLSLIESGCGGCSIKIINLSYFDVKAFNFSNHLFNES